ncbi:MAG TPA: hypothetical protein PLL88_06610 [Anaerolineaceae bacterium]|nr:hypothetical protein [Anaerolineaceae bacterium]
MKNIKFLFVLLLGMLFVGSSPIPVKADSSIPADNEPKVPLDCGVWAYDPVRSGSYVNGTGEISCATVHSSLKVVVGLKDWTNRYTSTTKTCYSTSYCSTTASLSYSPGRQWITDVSGYMGSYWQAYDVSSWVSIP